MAMFIAYNIAAVNLLPPISWDQTLAVAEITYLEGKKRGNKNPVQKL
jgi:hypothetical protein